MKPFILFLAVCAALHAVPAEKNGARFLPKSGNWADAKVWSDKALPGANTYAFVFSNSSAAISSPVPDIHSLWIGGNNASGTVVMDKQAKLHVLNKIHVPHGGAQNATGHFTLAGGELFADSPDKMIGGLAVGVGRTYSGQGFATLSGGVFTGSIMVGSLIPKTHQGTLSVVGAGTSVCGGAERERFWLQPSGTVVFYLKDDGISTLDYQKSGGNLWAGGKIIADGTDYRGGSKTFVLMQFGALKNEGAVLETRNFSGGYTAALRWEKSKKSAQQLLLSVTKK